MDENNVLIAAAAIAREGFPHGREGAFEYRMRLARAALSTLSLSPSAPARDSSAAVPADTVEPERAGGEAAQEPAGQSEALEPWRVELDEIIGHLGAAVIQSTECDDRIIMDHVKAAHEVAKIVRRKA